ncbi:54S ribosomal protein L11, mitochondrial [Wickerhamiella sorbophila]|uniref:54S ribosomal protein L11, mitochondrial n=1 Tax=Wickerhamiella sorbophila TaxID=45607 RepID=A0A2T0FJL9_9ASCO|nr:54S ribosomal protein L11, mitochondrial [Wickerhamiella sorbophila]PRT55178.1 54S ribosomal protein L11, mitochondrial [Wickerhamiella sorbophila]
MAWLRRVFNGLRSYSVAAAAPESVVRQTLKPLDSRKTYLVDQYTHLLRSNAVMLILHNPTLLKAENQQLRNDIRKAGGTLTVVRSRVFKATLRGIDHADPASVEAHKEFARAKNPLMDLFDGPSAVVTIPNLDPKAVDKVVSLIDKTRMVVLGGRVDGSQISVSQVQNLRKMPSLEELRAQLAGVLTVLGGAGLVNTLQASSNMLYLTLDQHRKTLEEPENK